LLEDDEFVSDWNFFGGDLNDCNQHYGDDELDRLHAAANKVDLFVDGPVHRGVT
jgi:hypothetical protein